MKRESIKFQISPYGSASSTIEGLINQGCIERRAVIPLQRSLVVKSERLPHLWVAYSPDVDKSFVKTYRQHSTSKTRLLIMNERQSSDTIVTRMMDLRIRSPQRFYVADCVATGNSAFMGALLQRLTSALERGHGADRILDAKIEDGILRVVSPEFKRLNIPVTKIPALANQDTAALAEFEIDEDGSFIYWPKLDVHIGWHQLIQTDDPQAMRKALQKNHQFNVRYGIAVRKVREESHLNRSGIAGLSEKQLGRIEKGECRLTSNAIDVLSRSHGLTANEYLQKLAEALPDYEHRGRAT